MKTKNIVGLLFVACFIMILPARADQKPDQTQDKTAAAGKDTSTIPVAVTRGVRFEFEPVVDGTEVVHEYIIENNGNAPLSIESVKTSCGCTTANYTKKIQPGSEGKITIKVNTRGYGGRKFSRSITVYTNDPQNKQLKLHISGEVEQFALIEPKRVFLRGTAGNKIQSVVSITPEKKYPFNIVKSYSDKLEKKIEFTLEKKDDKYILTVNNLMETSGRYWGRIHLKTDSSLKPEIIIYVSGVITEKTS